MSIAAVGPATHVGGHISVERHFTASEHDPYAEVKFEKRTAKIANPDGSVVFQMDDVEIPVAWSKVAGDILVSKYFRKGGVPQSVVDGLANLNGGKPVATGSEQSVRQVIDRITNAIVNAGRSQGYLVSDEDVRALRDELRYILVRQFVAFNSPVWFNLGLFENYGIRGDPAGNWAVDLKTGVASETPDGFSRPQVSACFIRTVRDDLTQIGLGVAEEMRIFKYGSGAGANFSTLRAKNEKLSGGGSSSGLMSFLKVYDCAAGSVKSGGTTRRAAKLVCLDADHPDIEEFIDWKAREEDKVAVLVKAGYSPDFNGEAYATVSGQNANNSVRVTDDFMQAVLNDGDWQTKYRTTGVVAKTLKAKKLMRKIAEAAHRCADPGMMFDTTINRWNTVPEFARIDAANPCVSGRTLVSTTKGLVPIVDLVGKTVDLVLPDGVHQTTEVFCTGERQVFLLRTKAGYALEVTEEHPIWFTRDGCPDERPARELRVGDKLKLVPGHFGQERLDATTAFAVGYAVGNGCVSDGVLIQTAGNDHRDLMAWLVDAVNARKEALREAGADGRTTRPCSLQDVPTGVRLATATPEVVSQFEAFAVLDQGSEKKLLKPAALRLDRESTAALLRGIFTADGTVVCDGSSGKNAYVGLDSVSLDLIRQVQQLLLCFGIKAKVYENRRSGKTVESLPDGKGGMKDYAVQESCSLRITRSSRVIFEQMIGLHALSAKAEKLREMNETVGAYRDSMEDEFESLEPIGTMPTYDLREPTTHHFVAGGLYIHNCNEFHFVNDSACNLASINLVKFLLPDGTFDIAGFEHVCRLLILAMDILVDHASYPTKAFAENSHQLRPLGLGYANLGALLMRLGIPYDSDEGRGICASITSLMAATAWDRSAEIASVRGPFSAFERNRAHTLNVARMHAAEGKKSKPGRFDVQIAAAAKGSWESAIVAGEMWGFRNAQMSLLAPTGTIGLLMDCDTTGIEPDFALVKNKAMAGGGAMKLVNQSVGPALERLGYAPSERLLLEAHIAAHETIEGSATLKCEHLPVFDCATQCGERGQRFIAPMAHVKMMAAAQPFLCGAISKTINMPNSATVEEIEQVYIEAWKLGIKALAVYRDGSKGCQVLTSKKEKAKPEPKTDPRPTPAPGSNGPILAPPLLSERKRLPKRRRGFTQEATIGGQKVYVRTGEYDDGKLGELFIDMAKAGSTIQGLLDTVAILTSLGLQHGVPLDEYVEAFTFTKFEPSGVVQGDARIKSSFSVIDYIFRTLAVSYLNRDDLAHKPAQIDESKPKTDRYELPVGLAAKNGDRAHGANTVANALDLAANDTVRENLRQLLAEKPGARLSLSADQPCGVCGNPTIRAATCAFCLTCGATTGCG